MRSKKDIPRAKVEPKNGRWSNDFLNSQLRALKLRLDELNEYRQKTVRSSIDEGSPSRKKKLSLDFAQEEQMHVTTLLEQQVRMADLETVQVAMDMIRRDLKNSEGHHEYGFCLSCEMQIPYKRLASRPNAIMCSGCQEELEVLSKATA